MRTELTLQEVLDISADIAKQGTYIERKMIKDILVYQALSGEEVKEKTITVDVYERYLDKINEVYENCTNDGLIDAQVNSILENRKIEIYESIQNAISKTLKGVNKTIDNYVKNAESKGIDLQGILNQMKEVK